MKIKGLCHSRYSEWQLPSSVGINELLMVEAGRVNAEVDRIITEFWDSHSAGNSVHDYGILPYPTEIDQVHQRKSWVFYAVPGCGKSRALNILLSKNWGFFFNAASLPVPEGATTRCLDSESNIYDPRREGFSKDFHYLWKMLTCSSQLFPGKKAQLFESNHCQLWLDTLVFCRVHVLRRFKRIAPFAAKPADWLKFQKDCDPFSPLFWLLVLQRSSLHANTQKDLGVGSNARQYTPHEGLRNYFIVLDEAQHDLGTELLHTQSTPDKSGAKGIPMLYLFSRMDRIFEKMLKRHIDLPIYVSKVYSGTSLRLQDMLDYLRKVEYISDTDFTVHSDFPLLRTQEEFDRLLQEQMIDNQVWFSEPELELIARHSYQLRGRYIWSTIYIDALKSNKLFSFHLNEISIRQVAAAVAARAKKDLKSRLTRLYSTGIHTSAVRELFDHLCWIVVNCNLFDNTKIIALDEYHALVDEGFAIVSRDNATKGSIEENLAMEAALEWFQHNEPELMQRKVRDVLRLSVLHDSNFGNAAEWFLALVSYFSTNLYIYTN